MAAPGSLFRPELPPSGIELSSPQGIALFQRALAAGTATPFFKLVEQLATQSEPAFCGLASLVTILNAIGVDPKRPWKGPWRYYSEELLDCCVDLQTVMVKGLDFAQLLCIGRCNGLNMEPFRAWSASESLFRDTLASCMVDASRFVVVCYSRRELGQTGDGHFSPLGAWDAVSDRVLILDVARFKYRPHWVLVAELWRAMDTREVTASGHTNRRGFVVASAAPSMAMPAPSRFFVVGRAQGATSLTESKRIVEEEVPALVIPDGSARQNLLAACAGLERVFKKFPAPYVATDPLVAAMKSTAVFALLCEGGLAEPEAVWWTYVLLSLGDAFWALEGLPPRPMLGVDVEAMLAATRGRLEQLVAEDTCVMCDACEMGKCS